jgi:hypothetical protein
MPAVASRTLLLLFRYSPALCGPGARLVPGGCRGGLGIGNSGM